ncbi:MAG TPA: IclR family transcriptional regulator C-terminal domain-containing protein, partial [Thermoleophilia bacterium]|nr:IclR family transcriptional regulator C-terminal domain-containing protein [Thermoleophilia bacterium]
GSSPGLDMFPREGERSPFNCGAGQRVLLAHAPETSWRNIVANEVRPLTQYSLASEAALDHDRSDIIKKGYSLGWEDIALHTCDVAAPVRNGKAEVVAAVSLCGIVQRFSAERLPVLIQAVMEAGNRLSTDLS